MQSAPAKPQMKPAPEKPQNNTTIAPNATKKPTPRKEILKKLAVVSPIGKKSTIKTAPILLSTAPKLVELERQTGHCKCGANYYRKKTHNGNWSVRCSRTGRPTYFCKAELH